MIIGIDLDGVIYDSEKEFRVYSELYDMIELKQNSKGDNRELKLQSRFKWTKEQIDDFFKKYLKQIVTEANLLPGVKRVLKMLKDDGHKLILITARGRIDHNMIKITEERFKNEGMDDIFDKSYWQIENKDEICLKEHVDIMIDDSNLKCKMVTKAGIKAIYLKDAPSYDIDDENIKVLYNWGEIYRYIGELSKNN